MSWIEQIQSPLSITTGDGKVYTPLWKNATRTRDYNVSEFDFANVNGTLVRRTTSKGRKYSFEFYFQGENCFDVADAFDNSNENNAPWIVAHPIYGTIIVQPISINYDNSSLNITKVTGTVIETLTEENPKTSVNPSDNIALEKENLDLAVIQAFDETPTASDSISMQATNKKIYTIGTKIIKTLAESQEYFDKFRKAQSAINFAASAGSIAMTAMQSVINTPAMFSSSVQDRVSSFSSQFSALRLSLNTVVGRSSKKIYETNGVSLLSALALAAINPLISDFKNKKQVLDVLDKVLDAYNGYLEDLDSIQSDNGGAPDNFIPNPDTLISLSNIINNTIAALFIIASQSRQERSLFIEDDTDIINLTHRLYGLDPQDQNIVELMEANNIGLNEIIEIRKGRTIVYYK